MVNLRRRSVGLRERVLVGRGVGQARNVCTALIGFAAQRGCPACGSYWCFKHFVQVFEQIQALVNFGRTHEFPPTSHETGRAWGNEETL